jgi:hypothetical protein
MHHLLHQRLSQNNDLERRMDTVEARINELQQERASISLYAEVQDTSEPSAFRPAQHEFEKDLNASWVYRRTAHRCETMSFTTSLARESMWSALSRCSLGDVSILSVVALPISRFELFYAWKSTEIGGLDRASSPTVTTATEEYRIVQRDNKVTTDRKHDRQLSPPSDTTLLRSPMELHPFQVNQDLLLHARVSDLVLTSVFAIGSVNKLSLLLDCPLRFKDASELQALFNRLRPTATLGAAKQSTIGLLDFDQRAEMLMSWLHSSYRGLIVPAIGIYDLPSMPDIHQFLVVRNPPEIEAAFQKHNHYRQRQVHFHGTSFDRLYPILRQGLRICSDIP